MTPENDSVSVELENLVAREAAEWRSSPTSRTGSLRQRKAHSSSVIEEVRCVIYFAHCAPPHADLCLLVKRLHSLRPYGTYSSIVRYL